MAEPTVKALREALLGRVHKPWTGEGVKRQAAVAAVFREASAGPEVLLIRRADHPDDPWSGHMAFPGGRHDPTDPDLLDTAYRETLEEVKVDLRAQGELLGRLDDVPAIGRARFTGLVIAPFVFAVSPRVEVASSPEVAETLWVPTRTLLSSAARTIMTYEHEGRVIELPAIDVDGRKVWGLTFHMLMSIFALIGEPHR